LDYPLENLGPERFQQFCQSLVLKEFPKVQCFPVAQPDGGRDAVSIYASNQGDKFTVFQVKFSRNPFVQTDPHKWLIEVMDMELEKAKALIVQGASQYLLLTNIPGTAHKETGPIDRLNHLMSTKLGIPAQCWWRDDIVRRLDNAWSLKWVYPELMTGPDFLRWITETGFSEHRDRRSSVVRAFLRTQYDVDQEVRFKQVELQNKLLSLFIDIPIAFRESPESSKTLRRFFSAQRGFVDSELIETAESEEFEHAGWTQPHGPWHSRRELEFEAASLLLSDAAQRTLQQVGCPGARKINNRTIRLPNTPHAIVTGS